MQSEKSKNMRVRQFMPFDALKCLKKNNDEYESNVKKKTCKQKKVDRKKRI